MPYIRNARRKLFDYEIERLQEKLIMHCAEEGDYNYVISRLVATLLINGPRYKWIARVTGVLQNVSSEFYRRIAAPYEDNAIDSNGDIPEFKLINEKIKNGRREKGETNK